MKKVEKKTVSNLKSNSKSKTSHKTQSYLHTKMSSSRSKSPTATRNEEVLDLTNELLQTINLYSNSVEVTEFVRTRARMLASAAIDTIYLDDETEIDEELDEESEEKVEDLVDLFKLE
jgi:hypothetical protein